MRKQKHCDIAVITREPFPVGMAATNRMISYLKPLAKTGLSINVLVTKPTEKLPAVVNLEAGGNFEGIDFAYIHNTTIWPGKGHKPEKAFILFSSYFRLAAHLRRMKPKVIITYTSDLHTKLLLVVLRPLLKFRLIIEETEYPKVLKKKAGRFRRKLDLSLYKKADGMLVMTAELEKYYRGLGVKNMFHLPMTVDVSRFITMAEAREKYFVYIGGSGGFVRDGVLDIIRAFDLFSAENSDYRLLIVGPVDENSRATQEIYKYIREHSLAESVILEGPRPTFEIPGILAKATAIIMAPPKDFESGGFPTKLGEFLASGTPTICTRVSEIGDYLDESQAYLTVPGDYTGLYHSMMTIINDTETANKIGRKGQSVAKSIFNAENYSERLKNFFSIPCL